MHGKPVLIYTLENFQNHPLIDHIILACLESWMDYAAGLMKKFGITKVAKIVPGGATGQESIFHGIKEAESLYGNDHIVLIYDGVRPLINEETITNSIRTTKQHGNAITVSPAIDSASLMQHYGMKLCTVEGPAENIKITTPSDFYVFRAIMDAKENLQILGL